MKNIKFRRASIEQPARDQPGAIKTRDKLTAEQRDRLIRSVIGSQAIEGIDISREEADRWLDEMLERHSRKMTLE